MIMIHGGCGPIKLPGYINIDIEPSHNPDICGDLLSMDFADVDVIYLCHVYEHFLYPKEAVLSIELFFNWLKPGGILRLAVPDLMLAAKDYVMGGDLRFLYGGDFKGYYYKDTPSERLNFFVKAWEHKMCYDFQLLSQLLADAGFRNIQRRQPNESIIPNFNHDRFISESLYIECIK